MCMYVSESYLLCVMLVVLLTDVVDLIIENLAFIFIDMIAFK